MLFIVVAPTGFLPHFLYGFDEYGPRYLTRLDVRDVGEVRMVEEPGIVVDSACGQLVASTPDVALRAQRRPERHHRDRRVADHVARDGGRRRRQADDR